MASRNTHPFGKPTGLSPADLQRHAEPAAYLTSTRLVLPSKRLAAWLGVYRVAPRRIRLPSSTWSSLPQCAGDVESERRTADLVPRGGRHVTSGWLSPTTRSSSFGACPFRPISWEPVDAYSLSIVTATPEPGRPEVKRAYVPIPVDYFRLNDEEVAPIDEAIADALMEQLGIEDKE